MIPWTFLMIIIATLLRGSSLGAVESINQENILQKKSSQDTQNVVKKTPTCGAKICEIFNPRSFFKAKNSTTEPDPGIKGVVKNVAHKVGHLLQDSSKQVAQKTKKWTKNFADSAKNWLHPLGNTKVSVLNQSMESSNFTDSYVLDRTLTEPEALNNSSLPFITKAPVLMDNNKTEENQNYSKDDSQDDSQYIVLNLTSGQDESLDPSLDQEEKYTGGQGALLTGQDEIFTENSVLSTKQFRLPILLSSTSTPQKNSYNKTSSVSQNNSLDTTASSLNTTASSAVDASTLERNIFSPRLVEFSQVEQKEKEFLRKNTMVRKQKEIHQIITKSNGIKRKNKEIEKYKIKNLVNLKKTRKNQKNAIYSGIWGKNFSDSEESQVETENNPLETKQTEETSANKRKETSEVHINTVEKPSEQRMEIPSLLPVVEAFIEPQRTFSQEIFAPTYSSSYTLSRSPSYIPHYTTPFAYENAHEKSFRDLTNLNPSIGKKMEEQRILPKEVVLTSQEVSSGKVAANDARGEDARGEDTKGEDTRGENTREENTRGENARKSKIPQEKLLIHGDPSTFTQGTSGTFLQKPSFALPHGRSKGFFQNSTKMPDVKNSTKTSYIKSSGSSKVSLPKRTKKEPHIINFLIQKCEGSLEAKTIPAQEKSRLRRALEIVLENQGLFTKSIIAKPVKTVVSKVSQREKLPSSSFIPLSPKVATSAGKDSKIEAIEAFVPVQRSPRPVQRKEIGGGATNSQEFFTTRHRFPSTNPFFPTRRGGSFAAGQRAYTLKNHPSPSPSRKMFSRSSFQSREIQERVKKMIQNHYKKEKALLYSRIARVLGRPTPLDPGNTFDLPHLETKERQIILQKKLLQLLKKIKKMPIRRQYRLPKFSFKRVFHKPIKRPSLNRVHQKSSKRKIM